MTWGDPLFPADHVDFGAVVPFKDRMLRRAFAHFRAWCRRRRWRDHFARFCDRRSRGGWMTTPCSWRSSATRDAQLAAVGRDRAVARTGRPGSARITELADEIAFIKFVQFQFQRQWMELRRYANERGIRIIGDIPIFVAEDSADVWANQEQFQARCRRARAGGRRRARPIPFRRLARSGVTHSMTGRRCARTTSAGGASGSGARLHLVDVVRIDHFRGFAAAWVVPAGAATAAVGHWERSPGGEVFAAINREFGDRPGHHRGPWALSRPMS